MIAPAMNPNMWAHPATQANLATLKQRGVALIAPEDGDTACGEIGTGRLAEPAIIIGAIDRLLAPQQTTPLLSKAPAKGLTGRHILVTSGPTYEPIDPVRYIANHSSGKQGHALAEACAKAGAKVTLVSGPVHLPDPEGPDTEGVKTIHVTTAQEMYDACITALPADCAICAAAVADWQVVNHGTQKMKKTETGIPKLELAENPDILASLSQHAARPDLVIGFAAETENLNLNAQAKRQRKKCDWIVANAVGGSGEDAVFGQDNNRVTLIDANGQEDWQQTSKTEVAQKLVARIEGWFNGY
jgi:phosphopantothenoylcysteine decarboxylase/phosphopantothenate--cysteine ligase